MMRRMILPLACVGLLLVAAPGTALAQDSGAWTGAGYFHFDGGAQLASPRFTSTIKFKLNGEDASLAARYRFVAAHVITGRAGVRVWQNIGFGLAVSNYKRDSEAAVTAVLPHPFFFNQNRNVSGTASGLNREETMVAAELSWLIRAGKAVDVMLLAGPAYFTARQDMVTMVRYAESYPYDTATYVGADKRSVRKNAAGFTAGLDLSIMFSRHVGVGGLLRYSRALASFSPAAGSSTDVTLGGAQGSAGIRFRF